MRGGEWRGGVLGHGTAWDKNAAHTWGGGVKKRRATRSVLGRRRQVEGGVVTGLVVAVPGVRMRALKEKGRWAGPI
jgi:hypothetical protein